MHVNIPTSTRVPLLSLKLYLEILLIPNVVRAILARGAIQSCIQQNPENHVVIGAKQGLERYS